jgi:hypothetical protein
MMMIWASCSTTKWPRLTGEASQMMTSRDSSHHSGSLGVGPVAVPGAGALRPLPSTASRAISTCTHAQPVIP